MDDYSDLFGVSVPQWLEKVAWEIRAVIRSSSGWSHVRRMVRQWMSEYATAFVEGKEWDRRRQEHHRRVCLEDRLRDQNAGPPVCGWTWEEYPFGTAEKEAQKEYGFEGISIGGWTPPELFIFSCPTCSRPLPCAPDHKLSENEKYAVLAAVHDCAVRGVEKIVSRATVNTYADKAYKELRNLALKLTERDLPLLRDLLTDVQQDLEARLAAEDAASRGPGDAGKGQRDDNKPARTPRYKPPPCPKCKGKVRVRSTRKDARILKCTKCNYRKTSTRKPV